MPVCQNLPADAIDQAIVVAFFQALSPVELDMYTRAVTAQQTQQERIDHARQQQLARLGYEADLAGRQFQRVDPDNRLVAAELEHRWEAALSALKQAEVAYIQQPSHPVPVLTLPPDLQERFRAIGQHLPQLWQQGLIGQTHKKALLRSLIDKVVVHRTARDCVQARIVWKGGDTTTLTIPVPVGSFTDLAGAATMEQFILEQSAHGALDEEIARQLTAQGYRSPMRPEVLASTVKTIRLKHRLFQKRSQSHPRHIAGYLTVPQLAQRLVLTPHWIYDRIQNGSIQVTKDPATGLYLFPDTGATLDSFTDLQLGKQVRVSFITVTQQLD